MKMKILILFIVMILLCFSFVVATTVKNETQKINILNCEPSEVSPGESFELSIDMSYISFDNFKIELSSNINLDAPFVDNSESIETKISDYKNIEITGSKDNLNILKLNYTVPEDISFGTSIQFIVKISSTDVSDDETSPVVIEDSITLSVVENSSSSTNNDNTDNETDGNSSNTINDEHDNNIPDNTNTSSNSNMTGNISIPGNSNMSNNSSISNGNSPYENFDNKDTNSRSQSVTQSVQTFTVNLDNLSKSANSSIQSVERNSSDTSTSEEVTYLGSSNNYLSSLSVSGFDFTQEFSKTNSTYFVTVGADTSSITINASAEDGSSTICVYGDDNLSSDINKILVNVTAENGNVRTYRIYVIKE